jgi:aryl-alcohol dehydrogenase-like predicted oxidoreductase
MTVDGGISFFDTADMYSDGLTAACSPATGTAAAS